MFPDRENISSEGNTIQGEYSRQEQDLVYSGFPGVSHRGRFYEIYDHKTNLQVRSHWQSLLDMYPDEFLFVVRDNASQHVTPMLDDFLIDNRDRLCLVPLPTY